MKRPKAIHHAEVLEIVDGKLKWKRDDREVAVMASADGYAMVRRPRCSPYVCREKELTYR